MENGGWCLGIVKSELKIEKANINITLQRGVAGNWWLGNGNMLASTLRTA